MKKSLVATLKSMVRQHADLLWFHVMILVGDFQKIRCGARRYPLRGSKIRFGEESGRQSTAIHVNKLSVNFELRTPRIKFPLRFFQLGGQNMFCPPSCACWRIMALTHSEYEP